ncbi:gliding motility-associated C-terminal domain-containing protein [Limnovirga soli]|uniref:gliding motility-associated C-terminal domain-containing protein n=1 Tax=Limnovirga soli TaxID=2656915 RepID=UPI00149311C5|nr:gliding motility-associated C-terminal domain-containing protein [Limnovirga soli]
MLSSMLFWGQYAQAQLCTGSLGDPIVSINFGAGTGRGAALGSSVTAYTYSSSGELGEGVYTIANTTSGLKGNAWHVTKDHTGNTNGYMMVVNSAKLASEGIFYTKTVIGLCPGTTYEFSAWLINIMNPSAGTDQYHPNVTFRINTTTGTELGTYSTGSIVQSSSATWHQYGFYFTTGTSSEVVITILNIAPSAMPGNDIALDDIAFRACGPSVATEFVGGGTSKEVCDGTIATFTLSANVSSGYNNPAYQWQVSKDNGSTWQDILGATSTYYSGTLTAVAVYLYRLAVASGTNILSANCRIVSNAVSYTIHTNPAITATDNSPTCYGDTLKLYVTGDNTSTFTWTGPNNFSSAVQNPVINGLIAANNGNYIVKVKTSAGCTNTDTLLVDVDGSPTVDAGNSSAICEGNSVTLNGVGSGSSFLWSPAETLSNALIATPVATPADTTIYTLTVSNGQCSSKDTVIINVWKKPIANAGTDKYMIEGTSVTLNGSVTVANGTYNWEPEYNITESASLTPVVAPAFDTTYTFFVSSSNGCGTTSDQVRVKVYKKISIPNTFSPNNDGINDTWSILQLNTYTSASISVFNRWGQIVFRSTGYTNAWDGRYNGKLLPVGTYYYIIDLKTSIPLHYTGWIALLR